MVATACIASKHQSFGHICQVAPIIPYGWGGKNTNIGNWLNSLDYLNTISLHCMLSIDPGYC